MLPTVGPVCESASPPAVPLSPHPPTSLCPFTDAHTDRLIGYGEPVPEAVGPLAGIVGPTSINKVRFRFSSVCGIRTRFM